MSTRFDLSHILHPAGLSPRPEGLRQVTPLGAGDDAPKPTHTLPNFNPARRAEKFPAPLPDQNPSPAPAGEGQGRGVSRGIRGACAALDERHAATACRSGSTTPTRKAKPMPASPNQDAVLAALEKHSPQDRAALLKATKLRPSIFDQTIFILNKQKRITKGGTQGNRQYGLPGTRFSAFDPAPKPAKKPKPANAPKPANKPRTTGTDAPPSPAPLHRPPALITHQPGDTRAIRLFDGGALILQDGFAVAELTAPQFEAVAQLAAA